MPADELYQPALTMATVAMSRMDAHEKIDSERFQQISTNMTEIKESLRDMARTLKDSNERIHIRIDDESVKTRHSLANVTATAHAEITAVETSARAHGNTAVSVAQGAADGVRDAKVWALTGLAGGAVAIAMWAVQALLTHRP